MSEASVSLDDQIKAVEWAISLLHTESERARALEAAAASLCDLRTVRGCATKAFNGAYDAIATACRVDDTRVSQAFERARMP